MGSVGSAPVLSVSDFVALVNQTLDVAYGSVIVEGEVSSFRVAKNKYVYFDIKDDTATVNCFMTIYQLRTPLEDGMRVRVYSSARLTTWGKFSLTVRAVEPVGEGALKKAFELLKAKLENEGLFDPARKRQLPVPPVSVGLITAADSAAAADFIKITAARWGGINIQLADVLVQGVNAPEQLQWAVEYFNQAATPPEVLVVIRGGGSADDLAAFSTEPLVRAIAGSRIPTLVAIGHETDLSLAELAADMRASTPSNAAELLVPDKKDQLAWLSAVRGQLSHKLNSITELKAQKLANLRRSLNQSLQTTLQSAEHELHLRGVLLEALNPATVLGRGYAIVKIEGRAVGSATKLKAGDSATISFRDGQAEAAINKVKIS